MVENSVCDRANPKTDHVIRFTICYWLERFHFPGVSSVPPAKWTRRQVTSPFPLPSPLLLCLVGLLKESLKALLLEAIFSATCNAMLTTTKRILCKLMVDMLHTATGFATLRKVEDFSTFFETCFAVFHCVGSCRDRVLHTQFLLH